MWKACPPTPGSFAADGKPDVDLIEGFVASDFHRAKATSHNPRSTVGTVTEIHDYLRLLFARVGTPFCPEHEQPLESQTVSQMVDHVLALPADTKLMVLAPVVVGKRASSWICLTSCARRALCACGWMARFTTGRRAQAGQNKSTLSMWWLTG